MKSKNTLLFIYLVSLVAIVSTTYNVLLFYNHSKIEKQLVKTNKLIDDMVSLDSISKNNKTDTEKVIEKYIDGCNILIDGKKVSTEDLVILINEEIKSNQDLSKDYNKLVGKFNELQLSNNRLSDSLAIYKAYTELSKKNLDIDYTISKNEEKYIVEMTMPIDSTSFYKSQYDNLKEVIKNSFGIEYNVKFTEKSIIFEREQTKLDTLMMLYDDIIIIENNNNYKIKLKK